MLLFSFGFNREPMNSWIMKHCFETHKDKYLNLSITQENDAFHVLPEIRRPPKESIERMCSPGFLSQKKYKYVERPIDLRLKGSFEELGNPPASPPYDEPVRDHSQDCVAKATTSNEDLGYAFPLNRRMRSLGTENEILHPRYKKTTTASGKEHQNLVCAEQIGYHSGISYNKYNATVDDIPGKCLVSLLFH